MPIRCVQYRLPRLNIGLFGLDPPCPFENLPEKIKPAVYRYTNIGCDEAVAIKFLCLARKRVEAIEQSNNGEEAEGEPGCVRLEARFEDKRVAVNALSAQSAMEFDVRKRDRHPGQGCGDCCKVLEPLENDLGARGARHIRQQGDGGGNADAVVWNAPGLQVSARLVIIRVLENLTHFLEHVSRNLGAWPFCASA